jgi:hypothetical protein
MLEQFCLDVKKALFKWLNRRSQRKSFDLDKFKIYLKFNPLPKPKISVNIYRQVSFAKDNVKSRMP